MRELPTVSGQDVQCACKSCSNMCERPCWPTPQEAQALIDAGYSERLNYDYWYRFEGDIGVLGPALRGYEGSRSGASWPSSKGGCTFWNNGLCDLHEQGLKPIEGRRADCKKSQPNLHEEVAKTWDNPEGRALVKEWLNRGRT